MPAADIYDDDDLFETLYDEAVRRVKGAFSLSAEGERVLFSP